MKRNSTRATAGALVAATIASVLALATTADRALAGQYHVYSCRTPDERLAPVDGWSNSTVPTNTASIVAEDTCASGGALVAGLRDGVKQEVGRLAMWAFTVPAGESLAGAMLWRAGEVEGGDAQNATYDFRLTAPNQSEPFDECVFLSKCTGWVGQPSEPLALINSVSVPLSNLGSHLYITAACGGLPSYSCPEGKNDPNGYSAVVYLYAADLILEDRSQPTVVPGSVQGELADASTVSGKASLLFTAEDAGSGVYDAVVSVDGKPLSPIRLDSNGGRCARVGEAGDGLPDYLYLQPCSPTASGDVQLDTTAIANGVHRVAVSVEDAAGNSTTVIDRQVDVANVVAAGATAGVSASGVGSSIAGSSSAPGAPNGSPATSSVLLSARWVASGGATLAGSWGRSETIAGRLTTAAGAPIAGAVVEANAVASSQGAGARLIATPRTDAAGRFELRLAGSSPSERVALLYRTHADDPLPAAQAGLTLVVPAHLGLKVTPAVSRLGGRIAFQGLLYGGAIPAGGKQVALQAHGPGSPWRTFELLSTDRRGRFRAGYRFRLPGPVVYRFRAISPHEADFPFGRGASNVVAVHER